MSNDFGGDLEWLRRCELGEFGLELGGEGGDGEGIAVRGWSW